MRVSIEGSFTVINKTNRRSKMKYTGTFLFMPDMNDYV